METEVQFQSTHAGHGEDLEQITLSTGERVSLAGKIAAKIPFDAILDELRDSVTESKLEITEKLFNSTPDPSKGLPQRGTLDQRDDTENSCVLFYKVRDVGIMYHEFLKMEDFVLVIMTDAHKEILQKFGSDCVCIDGTRGISNYGLKLVTLFVLDYLRQGFP